jgi:hypothetical protein
MLSYSLNYLAAFNISWVVTPPPINNILSSSDYLRTLDLNILLIYITFQFQRLHHFYIKLVMKVYSF